MHPPLQHTHVCEPLQGGMPVVCTAQGNPTNKPLFRHQIDTLRTRKLKTDEGHLKSKTFQRNTRFPAEQCTKQKRPEMV